MGVSMKSLISFAKLILLVTVVCCMCFRVEAGVPKWYEDYTNGLKAMEQNDWNQATQYFLSALQTKGEDSKKMRAFGTVFIEYFAHRELGICYYNLGQMDLARQELSISMGQAVTERARGYLERINQGGYVATPPAQKVEEPGHPLQQPPIAEPRPDAASNAIVGEHLSIAVLPFESKGITGEIGQMDLLDKLITGFVNSKRFKVIERAQLEKILAEQKLGMSGILDASTSAEIGKGIGVDAVVLGSVTRAGNSVSIDARLIDTETATIITAQDAYSNTIGFQDISKMILILADKIKADLPIVNGYVINVDDRKLTLDIGTKNRVKKGMKCDVYREGDSIIHPVTGQVIGKMIDDLCEVQITDVYEAYSIAQITKSKSGLPRKLDKVITK